MSSEEQKQSEAILLGIVSIALWISHYPAIWWPDLIGNYDLKKILFFWNKTVWVNWPIAFVLFASFFQILDNLEKTSKKNGNRGNSPYRPVK